MASEIKCPNCGHQFEPNEAIREEVQNKLRHQMREWQEKKDEEFAQKLEKEKIQYKTAMEETMRKSITADFENQLQILKSSNSDNEEKLKEGRKKELEFLQKEQQLKNREAEMEITLQKKLQQERSQLSEQIQKQESEKSALKENELLLKLKEKEVQLEEQKKLAEEMRRRAEQSSMQRQGEAQELLLESMLKENFPFDVIDEVGKGVEGADCIQTVRNASGKECGKIIYESKRTKGWSSNWIDKLKTDMRSRGADVAILVTQTFPKDMERFGEKDGIWICNFFEVASVATILRNSVLKVYEIQRSEENKGDKMQLLYNYLTGVEFKGQVEAIAEGFIAMRNSITKERMQMEKMWKEREKQLEKVLINTSGLYGSVKGIAGASVGDIPLLDGGDMINEIEY
ncbi:MAG: DUF2130 domain-containing protein [Rhizobacter sp.]|nr:DUF2130 domain-containing protein [Ferruginibacter sp.]